MVIICTKEEKENLIAFMKDNYYCPAVANCLADCNACIRSEIVWIEDTKTGIGLSELREIEQRAVTTYGKNSQLWMLVEEVAELQKEISKNLRGEDNKSHIAEEIADVRIMLDQCQIVFDIPDCQVTEVMFQKIRRLRDRLNGRT